MKRSVKKFVAFVTFLALALQLFAVTPTVDVSAKSSVSKKNFVIDSDSNTIYDYSGSAAKVSIPKSWKIESVDLSYNYTIESLTIPEGVKYVSLEYLPFLEKLTLPSSVVSIYISDCTSLKKLSVPKKVNNAFLYDLFSLSSLEFKGSPKYITIEYCPSLTKLSIPKKAEELIIRGLTGLTGKITLPSTLEYLDVDVSVSQLKSSGDGTYYVYKNGLYRDTTLIAIDDTVTSITVKDGTTEIASVGPGYIYGSMCGGYYDYYYDDMCGDYYYGDMSDDYYYDDLCGDYYYGDMSDDYYYDGMCGGYYDGYYYDMCGSYSVPAVETIKLPESVTTIDAEAFAGLTNLKSVNIPKNLKSIGYLAFAGLSLDKAITLPESLVYVDTGAFVDFKGSIKVEEGCTAVQEYKGGIYSEGGTMLLFYPEGKSSITLLPECYYIDALGGNKSLKTLTLSPAMESFYSEISLDYVETLVLDKNTTYVSTNSLEYMPRLKEIKVPADNPSYSSVNNCLYSKDKKTLIFAPRGIDEVQVYSKCTTIEGNALSNAYYYDEDGEWTKHAQTAVISKSVSDIGWFQNIDLVKVYKNSYAHKYFKQFSEEWWPIEIKIVK